MYTIGVKRRWWFGFTEYQVKAHTKDQGQWILNLEDGGQIHLPGVLKVAVKVYPNFWIHLHSLPRPEPRSEPKPDPRLDQRERAGAVVIPATDASFEAETAPAPYDYVRPEVKHAAAQRVRGILQESGIEQDSTLS